MTPFWSESVGTVLATPSERIVASLAARQIRHFRTTEIEQAAAWDEIVGTLKATFATLGTESENWWLLLEFPMLRLGMRIDAVILTDRAILVLEFKRATADLDARRHVHDYALNLRDFHSESRRHPIVPILVSAGATGRNPTPLIWHGDADVHHAKPENLAALLRDLHVRIGEPQRPLNAANWCAGAYRPVPTIIEAACTAYARHGVEEIRMARAETTNLSETIEQIRATVATAQEHRRKLALFVTGLPGAGKTLCGLTIAFAADDIDATFLTGNPSLVHVLREALVRDAMKSGTSKQVAEPRMKGKIQRLPDFRNEYVVHCDRVPPERIAIIDEAQRCWSRDYAIRKTRDRQPPLSDSEPGHLLDIMGRHDGFAACICLIGGGQEIHDGEGGLAEWGLALARRPHWRAVAPPDARAAADPRWRLGYAADIAESLHLQISVRHLRSRHANQWVDALLRGDASRAVEIAASCEPLPFYLTRSISAARAAVRQRARGCRRAGVLASSEAKRLRAEGIGPELPHMDAAAVAHWFLDYFPPDVRASDALELVATEFSCQGLELDYVLLCWDADLARVPGQAAWRPRTFRGTQWQHVKNPEAIANHLNTYRVLLTRARYETIIYVPPGDDRDPTRPTNVYDRIAAFLEACGAAPLDEADAVAPTVAETAEPVLL
ncbi:MAG TPA: DNA/RNA helicase domain-containing protein [Acetobacteraceae bacterium]|nr:DNA/RNA helicase domain-containing protein [Acetobacteraceae bacterium]